jgi:hypothetical protein
VGTFCFIVPVFSVVWYTQRKSGNGNTGPLIVGLSLMASALAVGPWTGAALNPARVLASPIVFDCPMTARLLIFYVLGEIAGAIAASLAVLPWYGISSDPWYADALPPVIRNTLVALKTPPSSPPKNVTAEEDGSPMASVLSSKLAGDFALPSVRMLSNSTLVKYRTSQLSPDFIALQVAPMSENTYSCVSPFAIMKQAKQMRMSGNGGLPPQLSSKIKHADPKSPMAFGSTINNIVALPMQTSYSTMSEEEPGAKRGSGDSIVRGSTGGQSGPKSSEITATLTPLAIKNGTPTVNHFTNGVLSTS